LEDLRQDFRHLGDSFKQLGKLFETSPPPPAATNARNNNAVVRTDSSGRVVSTNQLPAAPVGAGSRWEEPIQEQEDLSPSQTRARGFSGEYAHGGTVGF